MGFLEMARITQLFVKEHSYRLCVRGTYLPGVYEFLRFDYPQGFAIFKQDDGSEHWVRSRSIDVIQEIDLG